MAESGAVKLKDPYDDPSISTGVNGEVVVTVPPIDTGPDLVDPYDDAEKHAILDAVANQSEGIKLLAFGRGPQHPVATAVERGLKGAPGMIVDMANFSANLPKMLIDLGGGAVEKAYNMFADQPTDLPKSSSMLPFEMADINLPGGSEDFKNWLGAPKLDVAESGIGRVGQSAIEGGLSSIGPGIVGGIGKKLLPNLFKSGTLQELLAPSRGPWQNQLTLDTTSGAGATAGMQIGQETDDPYAGLILGGLGAVLPAAGAGARRLAREHLFGVTDPNEIRARLNDNVSSFMPPDYRVNLANDLERANPLVPPGVGLRPYQMLHDPYLGAVDSAASQIDPVTFTNQENAVRTTTLAHGEAGSPQGDPMAAKRALEARAASTEAGLAQREANIGHSAEAVRAQAAADRSVEDWKIDLTHHQDVGGMDAAQTAEEQRLLGQYEAEKARAARYADSVGGPDADTTKNAASQGIHESVTRQGEEAKALHGSALGTFAENNNVMVPGEELIKLRAKMQKEILAEGTGGLPNFLKNRKNNPMASAEGDMLDDYLYVTPAGVDKAAAAGAKPNAISVKQMIGWDQRLRAEASEAYQAGDMPRYQRIKQLRQGVNDLIDTASQDTRYQDLKGNYNQFVAKRFYTPTIESFFTPKGVLPEEAGAKALNASRRGAQNAQDTLKAIGDDPAGVKSLVDYSTADMVGYAYNPKTGQLDGAKVKRWMDHRAPMIDHLRAAGGNGDAVATQITSALDGVQHDQTLMEAAIQKAKENSDIDIEQSKAQAGWNKWGRGQQARAEHRDVAQTEADIKAEQGTREQAAGRFTQWGKDMVNRSAARFALGNDPEHMARGLMNSPDLARDAESMKRLLRNDPDATRGMQQAIYDQFMGDARVRLDSNAPAMTGNTAQAEQMLNKYRTLESKGLLPPGTVNRFRTMLGAEVALSTPTARAARPDQDLMMRLMVISGASRGVGGSQFGNLLTAAVRGIYGRQETEMIHKVLREAALNPVAMQELLRAQSKGQVELGKVVARQLMTLGYKPITEEPQ